MTKPFKIKKTPLKPKVNFNYSKQRKGQDAKTLLYTPKAKKIIRENKGLLKNMLLMVKENKEKIRNINYSIRKVKIPKNDSTYSYGNTVNAYVLRLKDGTKYYIKQAGNNVVGEMAALKYLEKLGFNTIPVNFAMSMPIYFKKFNETAKISFIAYDFTNLKTVSKMLLEKKITIKEHKMIERKLEKISKDLKEKKLMRDVSVNNCFIDIKTRKLYLFDPIVDYEVKFVEDVLINNKASSRYVVDIDKY